VINRLGFNNEGHDAAFERLVARRGRGIVGVNIGANKDAEDRIADYVTGLRRFYTLASYFTINISSPNTPGLRDLQGREQLADLLSRIGEARADRGRGPQARRAGVAEDRARHHRERARRHRRRGSGQEPRRDDRLQHDAVAGRPHHPIRARRAGLSGQPLFERSTIVLAKTRERLGAAEDADRRRRRRFSAETALAKIEAGADLVQLYTGMIYRGPGIANEIVTRAVGGAGQEGRGDAGGPEGHEDEGMGGEGYSGVITCVTRLVLVRSDRLKKVRSCCLEGREGSQHRSEVHTRHGSPAGPRRNRLRKARRREGHEPAFDCAPRMRP
jgi:dihydroorotate dehydrogenase